MLAYTYYQLSSCFIGRFFTELFTLTYEVISDFFLVCKYFRKFHIGRRLYIRDLIARKCILIESGLQGNNNMSEIMMNRDPY